MQYQAPTIQENNQSHDILGFEEFRQRKGLLMMANETINYNFNNGRLDYVIIGQHRFIVWNEKARDFNLNIRKPYKQA